MAGLIHAKIVKGKKLWYVHGALDNDRWRKEYPECKTRSDIYDALRKDLGLPEDMDDTDIVMLLFNKTWTRGRCVDEFTLHLRRLRDKKGMTRAAFAVLDPSFAR